MDVELTIDQQTYKTDLENIYKKFIKTFQILYKLHNHFEGKIIVQYEYFMQFLIPLYPSSEYGYMFEKDVENLYKDTNLKYNINVNKYITSLYDGSRSLNEKIDWTKHIDVYKFFSHVVLPCIFYLIVIARSFRSKKLSMLKVSRNMNMNIDATLEYYVIILSLRLEGIESEIISSLQVIMSNLTTKYDISIREKEKHELVNEFPIIPAILTSFVDFYNESLLSVKFNIENEMIVYATETETMGYMQSAISTMIIMKTVGDHMKSLSMLSDWKVESKLSLSDLLKERSDLFYHLDMMDLINEIEITLINEYADGIIKDTMKRRIKKFKDKLVSQVSQVDLINLLTDICIRLQVYKKNSVMIRYQIIMCQVLMLKFIVFIVDVYKKMLEKMMISDNSPTRPGSINKSFIAKYNESADPKLDIEEIKKFVNSLDNASESISIQSILKNVHTDKLFTYPKRIEEILIGAKYLVEELVKYSDFRRKYIKELQKTPNVLTSPRKFQSPSENKEDTPLTSREKKFRMNKLSSISPIKFESQPNTSENEQIFDTELTSTTKKNVIDDTLAIKERKRKLGISEMPSLLDKKSGSPMNFSMSFSNDI